MESQEMDEVLNEYLVSCIGKNVDDRDILIFQRMLMLRRK